MIFPTSQKTLSEQWLWIVASIVLAALAGLLLASWKENSLRHQGRELVGLDRVELQKSDLGFSPKLALAIFSLSLAVVIVVKLLI